MVTFNATFSSSDQKVENVTFSSNEMKINADYGKFQKVTERGIDGLSAYEIAVENGFVGSETEWLASLQGADGISPTITTSKSGKVTTLTIKDASGTKTATINDGEDGADGGDGIYLGDEEADATVSVNADTLQGYGITELLSKVYPVGSIYMSLNQLSPATLFGFGTWELIKDRFILGAGDIYGLGSTGGEASHTLTREELPRDTMMFANREANQWTTGEWQESANANWKAEPNSTTGYFETNGDQPHNNMPPYLAVRIWKRTA